MSNNITIYPNLSDLVSVSILPTDVVDVKGFLEQIINGSTQEIAEKKQRVLNNIAVIKSKAFANTFGINLDGTAKTMNLQDYNQLKWYASQAEKDLFVTFE